MMKSINTSSLSQLPVFLNIWREHLRSTVFADFGLALQHTATLALLCVVPLRCLVGGQAYFKWLRSVPFIHLPGSARAPVAAGGGRTE